MECVWGLSAVAWFSSFFSQVEVLVLPARSVAVMHAKLINQYMYMYMYYIYV